MYYFCLYKLRGFKKKEWTNKTKKTKTKKQDKNKNEKQDKTKNEKRKKEKISKQTKQAKNNSNIYIVPGVGLKDFIFLPKIVCKER